MSIFSTFFAGQDGELNVKRRYGKMLGIDSMRWVKGYALFNLLMYKN